MRAYLVFNLDPLFSSAAIIGRSLNYSNPDSDATYMAYLPRLCQVVSISPSCGILPLMTRI